jgi:hypothetical protein
MTLPLRVRNIYSLATAATYDSIVSPFNSVPRASPPLRRLALLDAYHIATLRSLGLGRGLLLSSLRRPRWDPQAALPAALQSLGRRWKLPLQLRYASACPELLTRAAASASLVGPGASGHPPSARAPLSALSRGRCRQSCALGTIAISPISQCSQYKKGRGAQIN